MILCCGEALIDMIPEHTNSGRMGYVPHSGGAIYNTSIALGRLGCETALLSGISTDLFGEQLMADMKASGVDSRFVIRSERPSTLAFVQIKQGHAQYSFFDENSAGRMLKPDDLPNSVAIVSALYFGGISIACEPGADTFLKFAESYSQNLTMMLDPNIRPSFIQDEDRFRSRLYKMIRLADIVKVSDEDLNWLIKGAHSLEEKAQQLKSYGPKIVILTRGSAGATAWLSGSRSVSVDSIKTDVVDTVGAGDTFNAGVMASLSDAGWLTKMQIKNITSDAIEAAMRFGARVAAATVSRAGANPPWRSDFKALSE